MFSSLAFLKMKPPCVFPVLRLVGGAPATESHFRDRFPPYLSHYSLYFRGTRGTSIYLGDAELTGNVNYLSEDVEQRNKMNMNVMNQDHFGLYLSPFVSFSGHSLYDSQIFSLRLWFPQCSFQNYVYVLLRHALYPSMYLARHKRR